ncbi:MAG: type II toxin-antitoxin system VapC family toxin [Niveispirillum sp.]|uniref:type II toxin-antitoxin system VapC family toxin n=1 Tax=Niveispirillum sp. TaxID=1917217 RepID=UPI003BA468CC
MRLLLDTHVFIWSALSPNRLPSPINDAICSGDNDIIISTASIWEIAIKVKTGRLAFPLGLLPEILHRMDMHLLDIHLDHVLEAGNLPLHHNDPFDRMLIAQARMEALLLVTADAMIPTYEVKTLSARA